jgi:putative transposase
MGGEIITRRNLPHWYVSGAFHFVTFRLAGTMPLDVLATLRAQRDAVLKRQPAPGVERLRHRELAHKRFFLDFDRYMDNNRTIDWLRQPKVAALLRTSLYYHHGSKYHLLAYCVMPNHVHVLLQPISEAGELPVRSVTEENGPDDKHDVLGPLAKIMHSLKSYTAHEANKLLGRSGTFWLKESYDHWVRDDEELERIVAYIAANPVTANLVREPQDWFFCSAHDRFLQDGSTEGFLRLS